MMEVVTSGLFAPVMVLGLLAWVVPKLLSMVMPEGVKALMLLAFVATLILFVLSLCMFVAMYLAQGVPWARIASFGFVSNMVFFGKLGLLSAMIWGPVMILSVAGLPRNWVEETW